MNRPELVLLHGWGLGSAIWSPCLPALTETVSPHLADLPGYGNMPERGQSFMEAAQALAHATGCFILSSLLIISSTGTPSFGNSFIY